MYESVKVDQNLFPQTYQICLNHILKYNGGFPDYPGRYGRKKIFIAAG